MSGQSSFERLIDGPGCDVRPRLSTLSLSLLLLRHGLRLMYCMFLLLASTAVVARFFLTWKIFVVSCRSFLWLLWTMLFSSHGVYCGVSLGGSTKRFLIPLVPRSTPTPIMKGVKFSPFEKICPLPLLLRVIIASSPPPLS